ncbi:PREDICTED: little elongation complex subunit 2-like [Priapulus caudatus]|uniref:Little elongation complex subunit 2-like n=1 Tax=Priapulus caudatus TaxID=37621 RepID=A0ABM1E2B7_PRICU|nr:PREDICTED: little elongation complex subunit 2-like [Priapulus caudatus]
MEESTAFCTEEVFYRYSVTSFEDKLMKKYRELEESRLPKVANDSRSHADAKASRRDRIKAQQKRPGISEITEEALHVSPEHGAARSHGYPCPKVPYPRRSELTQDQMAKYIALYNMYQNYTPPQQPDPLVVMKMLEFRDLQQIVLREQEEFMTYLKFAARKCTVDYSFLHPEAAKYVQERRVMLRRRVDDYPRFYQLYQTSSFSSSSSSSSSVGKPEDKAMLQHERSLLRMGKVPRMILNVPIKLTQKYDVISKRYPCVRQHHCDTMYTKQPISKDRNAAMLATKHRTHVAITSAGLRVLCNNLPPHFSHQWELPVTVRESVKPNGPPFKIVFVDKPLPANIVTAKQKNCLFHKYALKARLLHPHHIKAHRFSGSEGEVSAKETSCVSVTALLDVSNNGANRLEQVVSETLPRSAPGVSTVSPDKRRRLPSEADADNDIRFGHNVNKKAKLPSNTEVCASGTDADSFNLQKSPVQILMHDHENGGIDLKGQTKVDSPTQDIASKSEDTSAGEEDAPAEATYSCSDTDEETTLTIDVGSGGDGRSDESGPSRQEPQRQLPTRARTQSSHEAQNQGANRDTRRQAERCCRVDENTKATLDEIARLQLKMTEVSRKQANTSTEHQSCPESDLLSGDKKEEEEEEEEEEGGFLQPPEDDNVTYSLCTLGDIRLLVRCSYHGSQRRENPTEPQFVHLVPKLEYQLSHGLEEMTQTENLAEWLSLVVRPHCSLLRARINPHTADVVAHDLIGLENVTNRKVFAPAQATSALAAILEKLVSLPAGQYIVQHSPGDGHIRMLRNTEANKRGVYDLHEEYGTGDRDADLTPKDVPWVAIDPSIFTQQHRQHNRIPCTFDPADYVEPQQFQSPTRASRHTGHQKRRGGQGRGRGKCRNQGDMQEGQGRGRGKCRNQGDGIKEICKKGRAGVGGNAGIKERCKQGRVGVGGNAGIKEICKQGRARNTQEEGAGVQEKERREAVDEGKAVKTTRDGYILYIGKYCTLVTLWI